jgi:hypothetical protein
MRRLARLLHYQVPHSIPVYAQRLIAKLAFGAAPKGKPWPELAPIALADLLGTHSAPVMQVTLKACIWPLRPPRYFF